MTIRFVFPRWRFPINLGDSVVSTFIPRILKKVYPDCDIEVITQGFLMDVYKRDPNVSNVREPNREELRLGISYAFDNPDETLKFIYPEYHPKLFEFWRNNHDYLVNHPTANILTCNFLLQLKLEHLLFDETFDFRPQIYFDSQKQKSDKINVAIVPALKTANRGVPHPSCNGIGFRFNGPNGLDSWYKFTNRLKTLNPNIVIHEFSDENYGLGDVHHGHQDNFFDLVNKVDQIDVGVCSDGGFNNLFNSRNVQTVLFQATKILKVEFFKLSNSNYPEHLHLECRKECPSYFTEVFNTIDRSKTCNLECERLDPYLLAAYTNQIIKEKL